MSKEITVDGYIEVKCRDCKKPMYEMYGTNRHRVCQQCRYNQGRKAQGLPPITDQKQYEAALIHDFNARQTK